jgi:hypothetical protein
MRPDAATSADSAAAVSARAERRRALRAEIDRISAEVAESLSAFEKRQELLRKAVVIQMAAVDEKKLEDGNLELQKRAAADRADHDIRQLEAELRETASPLPCTGTRTRVLSAGRTPHLVGQIPTAEA